MSHDLDECSICHNPRKWHRDHKPRHSFQTEGGALIEEDYEGPPAKDRPTTPFDPVLRFLLVSKGVITLEELENAEKQLRSTGLLVTQEVTTNGEES